MSSKRRRSPTKPKHERDPRRVAAGMLSCGQSAGGRARAAVLTPKRRSAIARLGGLARGKTIKADAVEREKKWRGELEKLRDALVQETGRARSVFEPSPTPRFEPMVLGPATRTSVTAFLDNKSRYHAERLRNEGMRGKKAS
jgi:hypothetical protein